MPHCPASPGWVAPWQRASKQDSQAHNPNEDQDPELSIWSPAALFPASLQCYLEAGGSQTLEGAARSDLGSKNVRKVAGLGL